VGRGEENQQGETLHDLSAMRGGERPLLLLPASENARRGKRGPWQQTLYALVYFLSLYSFTA